MYFGGPMTYSQARAFCAKDNATMPYIDKHYNYHPFTEYLEREQVIFYIQYLWAALCADNVVRWLCGPTSYTIGILEWSSAGR